VTIYLPDTNACVRFLRGRDAALIDRWLEAAPALRLSAIVVAELHYGVARVANRPDAPGTFKTREWRRVNNLISRLPFERFNDSDAVEFGRLRARLERRGETIGPYDLLIAAQALRLNATIVTHNVREFQRVPGLKIEDWQQA